MRRRLALILLVSVCPLAFAQAYKWKDAQGVTHYADAPPPGNAKYEKIKTTGTVEAPAPAPAASAGTAASNSAKAAGNNDDTPANRKKLCDQLHKNVDILNNEKVVTMDDGKGGVKAVDDATRANQLKTTQAQITVYCQG
jgi:hypothetical protein